MNIRATSDILLNSFRRIPRIELLRVLILVTFVCAIWCPLNDRVSLQNWKSPLIYGGDAWWNLATIKAYQAGEISPFTPQTVASLNAPYSANWNDYPLTEKMLLYFTGIAARFIGVMPAFNLAGLMALVLASAAFYSTCRILRYDWIFSCMGAVLFGFSPYMFSRQFTHISLSYYWHVPLCLLITWWCFDRKEFAVNSPRWWFAVTIGIATGLQSIYYAYLFWQFLGFAALTQAWRKNRGKFLSTISIIAVSLASTVLMALPYVIGRLQGDPNAGIVSRSIRDMEIFGMKIVEFILPLHHRWTGLAEFGSIHYFSATLLRGELGSPYFGIVGIAGFLWLIYFSITRFLNGNPQTVPTMFWQSLWIIVFSITGGLNQILGVAGLQLFRATNRFSIFLLCMALLFLVHSLDRTCPRQLRALAAAVLLAIGLWDTLPPQASFIESQRWFEHLADVDNRFVQKLEQNVAVGTMAFQLPVMDFPEVPPKQNVGDYSNFRPYIFAHKLRFSYGSDKGRIRETWQHDVENLPAPALAERLERLGFGLVIIDRKGYADAAVSLLKGFEESGRKVIQNDQDCDYVAIALAPLKSASLPEVPPGGPGFYAWEGDWSKGAQAWSSGDATLVLTNPGMTPREKQYTFLLNSIANRMVKVITATETKEFKLIAQKPVSAGPFKLNLAPGENKIRFETDKPATSPGGGDPRMLAFSVSIVPEPQKEAVELGKGFYGWEGDWKKGAHSWSQGNATLILNNPETQAVEKRLSLVLVSTSARKIKVITSTETRSVSLSPNKAATVGPIVLQLKPGATPIQLETDSPPVKIGNDPRPLAYRLVVIPQPESKK